MIALIALAAATVSAAADPSWYVRGDTWQGTMFASREALARHMAAEAEKARAALGGALELGPWWVSKTLAATRGFDTVLPPEEGVVPGSGKAADDLWSRRDEWLDGTVVGLSGGGARTVYVFRTIDAKKAVEIPVWLGCDDRMTVWVDGKHVFTSKGLRGVAPNQDRIALPLKAGGNKLLMKIWNNGGAFGFYFHTSETPRSGGGGDPEVGRLWDLLARDFGEDDAAREMSWERSDRVWDFGWDGEALVRLAGQYVGRTGGALRAEIEPLARGVRAVADLAPVRKVYYRGKQVETVREELKAVNVKSLRLAVEDLSRTFPEEYGAKVWLARLDEHERALPELLRDMDAGRLESLGKAAEVAAFARAALLANPLLDFDRIAVVRRRFGARARGVQGGAIGAPGLNSHTNDDIPHSGWDNEIAVLSDLRGAPRLTTLYRPEGSPILRDMDVDFDGGRIMFSSIGAHDRWALFEVDAKGARAGQITPTDMPDVDFFDSCYLPDGRVVTCSTASYQGLPCEGGGRPMVNLYLMDRERGSMSQMTFEQDSDYHPCVLANGRLLYLRWEYSDIQHYYSRILFSSNPDGTNQMEYYGSGSYFPTAFKHARPCPGHPRKVVGIVSGHHATPETGRMAIIDPALGRKYPLRYRPKSLEWGPQGSHLNLFPDVLPAEKTGFVQEIPGHGKDVVGNVYDGQGTGVYPSFVYPFPLSENYILVSMKRDGGALWGIWLVDVFDNFTLVKEEEGSGLFEAFPLTARKRPPVIHDRVVPGAKTANVYITDVHTGPGLAGVPRGTVKGFRVFAYHFAYNRTGGHNVVGVESSWDVKRILGTVPVEEDGSASFVIPANTPISVQPLDADGAALQLMRSWMVGKPGENVSCGGCHERQNQASVSRTTIAARRPYPAIAGWHGGARPFAFKFEVQPVLEKFCVGCHDGGTDEKGRRRHSFRDDRTAYHNLHPYVRRPGPESDLDMTRPMEWHASTSPLVQMLGKGHHNVKLDREAWERLYCWIDLNAPYRGSWGPGDWRGQNQVERRLELARRYAGVEDDPESTYRALEKAYGQRKPVEFVRPEPEEPVRPDGLEARGFPFGEGEARRLQSRAGGALELDLGGGSSIKLVRVPAGEFVMGSQSGYPDERPRAVVRVEKAFWIGECEVTNAQYARFDPEHDTRYFDEHGKDQIVPGYIGNHDDQPVARVSWREATAFCEWLSLKSGRKVTLPTEAEWEWAARAGTAGDFYYGDRDSDFSGSANLSDRNMRFTQTSWDGGSVVHKRRPYDEKHHFPLRDDRFDDRALVSNYVGQYAPNAWGLKDAIGNVCEWTLSDYRPYPYIGNDGRNDGDPDAEKVARGGSWHDRPRTATVSMRFPYKPWQKVFNVGFRVAVPGE